MGVVGAALRGFGRALKKDLPFFSVAYEMERYGAFGLER